MAGLSSPATPGVNGFFVPKAHRSSRPRSLPRAFARTSSAAENSPSSLTTVRRNCRKG